jgi:flagellar basal body rod protein FlgG
MSNAIQYLTKAIQSGMKQVEVVSQNVANAQTPGFKALKTSTSSFDELLGAVDSKLIDVKLNMSNASLKVTERWQDLTLSEDGFFITGRQDGKVSLARNIQLQISADGELQAQNGNDLGIYLPTGTPGSSILVSTDGGLSVNGKSIGKLEVVQLINADNVSIDPEGQLITNEDNTQAVNGSVLQGHLEQSNVDSSQELIKLMRISKHIESSQRSLLTIDQMLETGINKIGN